MGQDEDFISKRTARQRACRRLRALAKQAAKLDCGRLPNQLSAFAVVVDIGSAALVDQVRSTLEERLTSTSMPPDAERIMREALEAVMEVVEAPEEGDKRTHVA